eukprot:1210944-Alexandrium_andersonii.AAC.1
MYSLCVQSPSDIEHWYERITDCSRAVAEPQCHHLVPVACVAIVHSALVCQLRRSTSLVVAIRFCQRARFTACMQGAAQTQRQRCHLLS